MFLSIIYVVTAFAFLLLAFMRKGLNPQVLLDSTFALALIYLLVVDLRECRVPRGAALATLLLGLFGALIQGVESFRSHLLGAVFGFLSLWCVLILSTYILRRAGHISLSEFALGNGDPWLLAAIGANMGVLVLPAVLFLGSLQGVFVFALSRASKRLRFHIPWPSSHTHQVPFGTFLCLAALELVIWPDLMLEITSFIRSSN